MVEMEINRIKKSLVSWNIGLTETSVVLGFTTQVLKSYLRRILWEKNQLLNKKIKPRNIFTKAIDSIVELRCEKGLSIVYGTAIIYNKEGYLVTNAHVVTLMHGDSVIEYSSYHVKFATEND